MRPSPPHRRNGSGRPQLVGVGSGSYHRHPIGFEAITVHHQSAVRLIGGYHVIGEPSRTALEEAEASVQQRGAFREARLERLRAEVMVVEHEPGAMQELEQDAYGTEDVRRIAALDRAEATAPGGLERLDQGGGERVEVFGEERGGAAPWTVRPVLVDLDSVDDLVRRVSRPLGADDRHLVTGSGQGAAFQPDPAVERHRQVLDDDEDASGIVPVLFCFQQGSAPGVSAGEGLAIPARRWPPRGSTARTARAVTACAVFASMARSRPRDQLST